MFKKQEQRGGGSKKGVPFLSAGSRPAVNSGYQHSQKKKRILRKGHRVRRGV